MPLGNLGEYEVRLGHVVEACERLWEKPHHYHYTEHGPEHSRSIIEKLSKLLSGQSLKLSPVECFILQAACFLHDVGMQCMQRDLLKSIAVVDAKPPYSYEPLERIREKHAELSCQMIKNAVNPPEKQCKDLPDLGLAGINHLVVDAIAKVSKAHSDNDFEQYCKISDRGVPGGGARMRLLAVLLRIGDSLDADSTRCNWANYTQMEASLFAASKAHFWKHFWVSNVNIENGRIGLTYVVPESYGSVKRGICDMAESYIRMHREDQKDIWKEYDVRIDMDEPEFMPDCPDAPRPMPQDVIEFFHEYSSILRLPETYRALRFPHRLGNLIVAADGNGHFTEIQAAIDTAYEGDMIEVKPGIYREAITFKSGVRLFGTRAEDCRIESVDGADAMLIVTDCRSGSIKNLTFDGRKDTFAGEQLNGLALTNSKVDIEGCVIQNVKWSGVAVSGTLSSPRIRNNRLHANGRHGIYFERGSSGTVEANKCENNGWSGIAVYDSGTSVTINNNRCSGNKHDGIHFARGACGSVTNSNCASNGYSGIGVIDVATSPTLKDNNCSRNTNDGIHFARGADGSAESNVCENNGCSGIGIINTGTTPTLSKNQCGGNKDAGIFFGFEAGGMANGNKCEGNGTAGIRILGSGTAPRLQNNQCRANREYEIWFCDGASAKTQKSRENIGILLVLLFGIAAVSGIAYYLSYSKEPEKEKFISETDGAEMVVIPTGEFLMGSPDGEGVDDEHPRHLVRLDAFCMDTHEVTNAQYKRFCDSTKYLTDAERIGWGYVWTDKWEKISGANWLHPHGPQSSIDGILDHPVVQVSWNDANAYANWAGKRLPTEAEWEKAARGRLEGSRYVWGNGMPRGHQAGNFADETAKSKHSEWRIVDGYDDGYSEMAACGSFSANGYGLYDMAGNVWEWCLDWYGSDYYRNSPTSDPNGPPSGQYRVIRGGSWLNVLPHLGVANRSVLGPGIGRHNVGFRCVLDTK